MKRSTWRLALAGMMTVMSAATLPADDGGAKWFLDSETTLFSFYRSPGTQVGDDAGDAVNFDLKADPRITFGFANDQGIGARIRYWEYDHTGRSDDGGGSISVDALTFDFEAFQNIRLSQYTTMELAAGIRYNEFEEILRDGGSVAGNEVEGVAGIISAAIRRELGIGALNTRGRFGLMMDDKAILDDSDGPTTANNTVLSIAELSIGYEVSRCCQYGLVTGNLGVEWQKWTNYTEGHDVANDDSLDFRGGGGDVGFFGIVLGAEVSF